MVKYSMFLTACYQENYKRRTMKKHQPIKGAMAIITAVEDQT
ncbi:hypothetical protein MHH_c20570 [Mannheimia haemolytica M42548]|nr:hypothetical protein MHH_c20570 [Mannheimia haemolytica M42548]